MVRFIVGGAERDVSAAVINSICKALSDGCEKAFFIVPDQFQFENEMRIYSVLEREKMLDKLAVIQVVSFNRLASDIIEDEGETLPPAGDVVKSVVMSKAVAEQKNILSAFGAASGRSGFCEKMVQTVSGLKALGVSAEKLRGENVSKMLSQSRSQTMKKLSETAVLFSSYENYLEKYADSLDLVEKAARIISREGFEHFKNAEIFIDSFNDFTAGQNEFLRRLICRAKNITAGFVSEDDGRGDLFFSTRVQMDKLRRFAEDEGVETIFETESIPLRFSENSPLFALSKKLFSVEKGSALPDTDAGKIEIISAADPYEEADFIAAKIRMLCVEKGYFYRETAVLCANVSCAGAIKAAFEKYDIPAFYDIPETILYRPVTSFFITVLDLLKNFTTDGLLSYIKSGFLRKNVKNGETRPVSGKEINSFEKYVFEWDIKARQLRGEFNFGEKNDPERLDAEEIRKLAAEPILELRKRVSGKTGSEITRELYDFAVNEVGIGKTLSASCTSKAADGTLFFDPETVRVNQQVWDILADIFSVLEEELRDRPMTVEEYARTFTDICTHTSLSSPPQFLDQVLVGDIARSRVRDAKAVFIAGADYNSFPAEPSGLGVFSEYETELIRDEFEKINEPVSLKTAREQYYLSLYKAYRALTLPAEYLCVSFSEYSDGGKNVSRSAVINDIISVFSGLKPTKASELPDEFYCCTIKALKQRFAANSDKYYLRKALEMSNETAFTEKIDEIKNNSAKKINFQTISKNTAERLFAADGSVTLGATYVEKLNICKFGYFCENGLGLRGRKKRIFNPLSRGNAMHYVLQKILQSYKNRYSEFFKLERAEFLRLARFYLGEFCRENTGLEFNFDRRSEFLFGNLASSAADLLIMTQAELAGRSYRPQFFELDISKKRAEPLIFSENDGFSHADIPEASLFSELEAEGGFSGGAGEFARVSSEKIEGSDKIFSVKPLEIKLSNGINAEITGKIDRADLAFFEKDGKSAARVRVVDYKTSLKSFSADNARAGVNIQMLLYLAALCQANSDNGSIAVFPGEISYIPSKCLGASESKLSALSLILLNNRQSGIRIITEDTEREFSSYAEFIKAKVEEENKDRPDEELVEIYKKIDAALRPAKGNEQSPQDFEKLERDCVSVVKKNLDELLAGDVSPSPLRYNESKLGLDRSSTVPSEPCKYCEFAKMCTNAGREYRKVEKEPAKTKKGAVKNAAEPDKTTENGD